MKKRMLLASLLVLSALLLRLNNLGSRSLWTDEFFTLFESTGHGRDIARLLETLADQETPAFLDVARLKALLSYDRARGIPEVSGGLLETDTHPPLYFWIMHFWIKSFGNTPLAVRFFSLICGMLCLYAGWRLTFLFFGEEAAGWALAFMAFSPFAVRYSQEARAYSLLLLWALMSVLCLVKYQRSRRLRDALCFAACMCLGIYTHYFFAFIAVAIFAYCTLAWRRDSCILSGFYLAFLLALLGLSWWVVPLMVRGYNFHLAEWVFGYPGFLAKVSPLLKGAGSYFFMAHHGFPLSSALWLVSIGVFVFFLARAREKGLWFCLALVFVPLLAMLSMDLLQNGALLRQERFWMFPFVGVVPLAGVFLREAFKKAKPFAIAFIALMCASSVGVSALFFGPAPKAASQMINARSQGALSVVMVLNIRSVIFSQAYYLDDGIYMAAISGRPQLEMALEKAAMGFDRIFVARYYHPTDSGLMDQPFMEVPGRFVMLDGVGVVEVAGKGE